MVCLLDSFRSQSFLLELFDVPGFETRTSEATQTLTLQNRNFVPNHRAIPLIGLFPLQDRPR